MEKKVKEINCLEISPLKSKNLAKFLEYQGLFENFETLAVPKKSPKTLSLSSNPSPNSQPILFSPTFEVKTGDSSPIGGQNSSKQGQNPLLFSQIRLERAMESGFSNQISEFSIENFTKSEVSLDNFSKFDFNIENASLEDLKQRKKDLEEIYKKKKIAFKDEYERLCNINDSLKKNLEKIEKESKIDGKEIIKYYSRKIFELLKDTESCKIDLFNTEAREYKLTLDLKSIQNEIENLVNEINNFEVIKNNSARNYGILIKNISENNK